MTLPDAMELARLNGELGLALTEALVEIDRLRLAATPAPLDARGTPYSMESVRSWMGLDVWLSLGHDFHDWPGWTADGWADMMAEIRPLAATPAPLDRLRARISLEAINGTRPVWIGEGVFERYAARTAEGWPVTIEWGEPDADGFYSPVFTEHPEP